MNSPDPLQRVLRVRLVSFSTAVLLHLGWALALVMLLVAVRRALGGSGGPVGALCAVPLATFALVCGAGSAVIWGRRREAVRWIRRLNDDDIAAALAAACTAAVSLTLTGVLAVGFPSMTRLFSRGEIDAFMAAALGVIGVLSVSLGWILFEGLGGISPPIPGKLEASLRRRGHWPVEE